MAETNVKIKLLTDIQSSLDALATFQKQATKSIGAVEDSTVGLSNSFKRIGEFAVGGILKDAVVAGFNAAKDAIYSTVQSAVQLENALTGLRAVASSTGNDVDGVTAIAKRLSEDGLIPLSDTAAALKNLLATGIDADKAEKAFLALRDAAAFNRQGQLQLGEAVVGATQGIKNQLSVLVDNAGITKNLSVLQKEYAASLGRTVGSLTDQEKVLANVNGVIKEAALFQGNYNLLLDTFSGATSKVTGNVSFLSAEIGQLITNNKSVLIVINAFAKLLKELRVEIASNQEAYSKLVTRGVLFFLDSLQVGLKIIDETIKAFKILGAYVDIVTSIYARLISKVLNYGQGADEAAASTQAFDDQLKGIIDTASKIPDKNSVFLDLAKKIKEVRVEADITGKVLKTISLPESNPIKVGGDQLVKSLKDQLKEYKNIAEGVANAIKSVSSAIDTKKKKADKDLSDQQKQFFNEAQDQQQELLKKQQAATGLIASAAGSAIKAAFPGIGEIIGPIVAQLIELFAKGREFVQAAVTAVFEELPNIIINILDVLNNLPQILTNAFLAFLDSFISGFGRFIELFITAQAQAFLGLLSKMPELIDKLIELTPILFERFASEAPKVIIAMANQIGNIIDALIKKMPVIIDFLLISIPKITEEFTKNLIIQLPRIISVLALTLKDALVDAAKGFVDEIKRQAGKLTSGGLKGLVGLADGGKVPAGFNNDNFPARLTSGELVVPRDTVRSLESFLGKQNSGSISSDGMGVMISLLQRIESKIGSEDIVVNVGGKQLIATIRENIKSGRVLA